MDEMKKYWVDFAEGKISVSEMLKQTEERPELLEWLTKIADPKFKTYTTQTEIGKDFYVCHPPIEHPFNAKLQIQVYVYEGQGSRSRLGRYLNVHSLFSRVITTAFPDDAIAVDKTLDEKFCFMLDACPQYIGGPEVDHFLDELLEEIPAGLSKTRRIRLYKEKIKALFPLAGKKYPHWVQDAEWPISPSGKPMRFVEQKRKKGKEYAQTLYTHFIFEDVDTGEVRIIDQFT
ncbi:MAG: hypothetical protein IJ001_05060 [Oscillospiraceae bacterium]|nr:hypothetical protein [Oscillospiraceae bacterium]